MSSLNANIDIDPSSKQESNINQRPEEIATSTSLNDLRQALYLPALSLLSIYLEKRNGSRKTIENCISDFAKRHSRTFRFIFLFDFVCRVSWIIVILLVVLRGIGVIDYIKFTFF